MLTNSLLNIITFLMNFLTYIKWVSAVKKNRKSVKYVPLKREQSSHDDTSLSVLIKDLKQDAF